MRMSYTMVDLFRENFSEYFPEIKDKIEKASFIGIDCEFTGLTSDNADFNSWFEDVPMRYQKLKDVAQKFTICQFGISSFVKTLNKNEYKCFTYNFYLFPPWNKLVDTSFTCQASSMQFLCYHNFDFNKWFYHGLSYLTQSQEQTLREQSKSDPASLSEGVETFLIKDLSRRISTWVAEGSQDKMTLGKFSEFDCLGLQLALSKSFPHLVFAVSEEGELIASKLADGEVPDTEQEIAERILDYICGFSKVFKLLHQCQKPIIGHNCLTDFLLMYENFHQPLPGSLSEFKVKLHQLFPTIIDTKHVVRAGRKIFREHGLDISGTSLDEVHSLFKSSKVLQFTLFTPDVVAAHHNSKYSSKESLHEAGYDAYLAGVVFLRMAHFLAAMEIGTAGLNLLNFNDYMSAMRPYVNNLNLIRANIAYLNLTGKDPVTKLPGWIHIESQTSMNASELAYRFGEYGTVDVKILDQKRALLAVGTFSLQREILKDFKNHKEWKVTRYNIWQHNRSVRLSLWAVLAVTAGLCTWVLLDYKLPTKS